MASRQEKLEDVSDQNLEKSCFNSQRILLNRAAPSTRQTQTELSTPWQPAWRGREG